VGMSNKKTKRIQLVQIVKVSSNAQGDQLIELMVDGELRHFDHPEGNWVDDVHSWINRTFKPVAIESSGANALNRLFG